MTKLIPLINKWYNKEIPTTLGVLVVSLVGVMAGFVIVQMVATLPSGYVNPVFTPKTSEINNDSNTSEWQIYRNNLGGYEIEYPINCDVTISNKKILTKSCGGIEVFDHDFEKDWSVEKFMDGVDAVYSNQKEFYVNGHRGIKADFTGLYNGKSAVIKKDGVFYNIFVSCNDLDVLGEDCSQVFDQILSTFKFID